MKRIFNSLAALFVLIVLTTPIALAGTSFACGGGTGSSSDQVLSGVGETGVTCNSSNVTSLVSSIINVLSMIAGIIAIIMIIVSAMRFMTSGGDTQKVSSAKNSLIYAIVGLAVAALAQAIVVFVLNETGLF